MRARRRTNPPILYLYITHKLQELGKKEISSNEFWCLLSNKVKIKQELWFDIMKELVEYGLIKGYEDTRHTLVLKAKLTTRQRHYLSRIVRE